MLTVGRNAAAPRGARRWPSLRSAGRRLERGVWTLAFIMLGLVWIAWSLVRAGAGAVAVAARSAIERICRWLGVAALVWIGVATIGDVADRRPQPVDVVAVAAAAPRSPDVEAEIRRLDGRIDVVRSDVAKLDPVAIATDLATLKAQQESDTWFLRAALGGIAVLLVDMVKRAFDRSGAKGASS